jgi:hypothetical protein
MTEPRNPEPEQTPSAATTPDETPRAGAAPPAGRYGEPPSSGGYVPPPPPHGGYSSPESAATGPGYFTVGGAFRYGWRKFTQNLGPILLIVLVLILISVVLEVVGSRVARSAGDNAMFGAGYWTSILFNLLSTVVSLVIAAGVTKAALDITRGQRADFGTMFQGIDFVQVVLAAILVGIATTIGLVLFILPGLIVAFLCAYTTYFVVDKHLSAIDAIMASVRFVAANVGNVILMFLMSVLVFIVGALLCGVGLLAAIPVVIIAQAFAYRTLQGESVAA